MAKPEKVTPCQIEIWDIAGLIKGASEGAGLGNKFLQNIREVNSIIHLVRCFEDINVIYSEGDVNNLDPITEMEDVQTELILSDLEICAKKTKKKGLTALESRVWQKVFEQLDQGEPIRTLEFTIDEIPIIEQLPFITAKPLIFACNIGNNDYDHEGNEMTKKFIDHVKEKYPGTPTVILSSLLEEEISQIRSEEGEEAAQEYMELSNIPFSALD